ncbi:TPR repeat-containing protein [Chondromyces apiculatus DSM 436]|uniref:TPR repeat-containing protein n=1 Tax=Chondromyces apiculatus DSM 436 TaxID=1192034 RepID=A0A017SX04_9BACT|nr:TPR repeat-containing protein [Chondromyces apiculatus DSM 436]
MGSPLGNRSEERGRALVRALVVTAVALLALLPTLTAPPALAKESKGPSEYGCRVQKPQAFLKRGSFVIHGQLDGAKQTKAVRYLTEHYGHVDETLTAAWNGQSARSEAKSMRFMGLPISVHAKMAPALACVEKRIQQKCRGKSAYTPRAIGGFRGANTYRGGEVSNHLFGIAIDIDPDRNPCCGCVDPWPSHPLCKLKGRTAEERTAMPSCWIKSFERFGFYWLGDDTLEDTMHFEFLGDPDKVNPAAEKRAAEKRAAEKRAADKVAAEKRAADKTSADKAAAEKKAAEKAAAEKRAAERASSRKRTDKTGDRKRTEGKAGGK